MSAAQTDWQSVLSSAADGGQKLPPLLVVIGEGGIGKTSFALKHSPRPACVLAFEIGARSIRGTKVYPKEEGTTVQSWQEALTYLRALAYGPHEFRTVVLDTFGPMEALLFSYVVQQSGKGTYEKMGYGKENVVVAELRIALALLERIKAKGVQIIVLAHEGRKKNKNPVLGEYYELCGLTQVPSTWDVLFGWADIVGYASYNYGVVDGRLVKIDDTRRLFTKKGAGFLAKQREGYELASPVALDWTSFATALEHGSESAETIINRITALSVEMNDADVSVKTRQFVKDCNGDAGKLLELENQLRVMKENKK